MRLDTCFGFVSHGGTSIVHTSCQSTMSNHIEIIPFCTPLPSGGSTGVVGTITLRGPSAIVWFGWGDMEPCDNDETCVKERAIDEDVTVGSGE